MAGADSHSARVGIQATSRPAFAVTTLRHRARLASDVSVRVISADRRHDDAAADRRSRGGAARRAALRRPARAAVDLDAVFEYDPPDPYAVVDHLPGPAATCIRWAMGRAAARAGPRPTRPARATSALWPSLDEDGRGVVVLEFHSPDGRLVAQASHPRALPVPDPHAGRRCRSAASATHVDVDELIDDLLGGSEPE